jgi:hypothetical protein
MSKDLKKIKTYVEAMSKCSNDNYKKCAILNRTEWSEGYLLGCAETYKDILDLIKELENTESEEN